jgi:hypothetical protein
MRILTRLSTLTGAAMTAGLIALAPSLVLAAGPPGQREAFVDHLQAVSTIASTVPANGDVNPYGTAVVPRTEGSLVRGDVLVSNFNNNTNAQGTGSTIVEVAPNGAVRPFAEINAAGLPGACPGGVGLTTALAVLRSGWVIVGSLPTSDGTAATAQAGCLLVLNGQGQVVETLSGDGIDGPWDMTALDRGGVASLFVTNVLNGTVAAGGSPIDQGTVLRIDLRVSGDGSPVELGRPVVIASGFPERTDPSALVIGPTGAGLGPEGTLYVADTLDNRIAAVPDALSRDSSAGTGETVSVNGALNGPLGLAIANNGDILTVNSNDGNLVETSPSGTQLATRVLDDTGSPAGAGTLFGLAVTEGQRGVYFVDDGSNTLNLLHGSGGE